MADIQLSHQSCELLAMDDVQKLTLPGERAPTDLANLKLDLEIKVMSAQASACETDRISSAVWAAG